MKYLLSLLLIILLYGCSAGHTVKDIGKCCASFSVSKSSGIAARESESSSAPVIPVAVFEFNGKIPTW